MWLFNLVKENLCFIDGFKNRDSPSRRIELNLYIIYTKKKKMSCKLRILNLNINILDMHLPTSLALLDIPVSHGPPSLRLSQAQRDLLVQLVFSSIHIYQYSQPSTCSFWYYVTLLQIPTPMGWNVLRRNLLSRCVFTAILFVS